MANRDIVYGIRITGDSTQGEAALRRTAGAASDARKGLESIAPASASAAAGLRSVATAAVGFASAGRFIQLADEMTVLDSRLRLATASASEAAEAYSKLYQVAIDARVNFSELGNTYSSMARAVDGLGFSQTRMLGVTESVSQAMAIGGGAADSMRAALVQFSQGLASGVLRGEELNSIMEQAPRLAQAIAEGLGKTRGELREMGEQGQLTTTKVIEALERMGPTLKNEFQSITPTIGGAFEALHTRAGDLVKRIDQAASVSKTFGGAIDTLGKNLDVVAVAAGAVGAMMVGRLVGGAAQATAGFVSMTASALAAKTTVDALGVSVTTTTARMAAGQLASTAAASALGMLGGPIGLITAALGIGVSAWLAWGDGASAATKKAADGAKTALELLRSANDQVFKISGASYQEARSAGLESIQQKAAEAASLRITGANGSIDPATFSRYAQLNAEILATQRELSKLEASADKVGIKGVFRKFVEDDGNLSEAQKKAKGIKKLTEDYQAAFEALDKNAPDYINQVKKLDAALAQGRKNIEEKGEKKTPKSPGESIEKDWIRRLAVLQAEAGATTQLTETEKAAVKVMTEFAQGKLKLTAAEKERLPGLVQEALLLDDAAEAAKKAKVEQEALAKAQEAAIAAVRADTQALLTKLDAAQFEAETYGMTEEAVYRLLAARAQDRAEMNAFGDANDAVIAELKAQAQAYLELADAAGAKAGREAQRKAGEEARANAQRFADDLERALTDSLMRSFEAGKGFGDAFLSSIKNMLKTAALKAVVQVIMSPITGGISGIAGAGMSTAGGGSSSLMGTASNINTLSNLAGYGAIGYQWATGSMSGANAIGTVSANATGSGLDGLIAATDGWGTVAADAGTTAGGMSGLGLAGGALGGAMLGYQLGGGNALGTFAGGAGGIAAYGAGASAMAGGSLAAGASAALAAVPVWGWIALAALALGGSMATGGTPHLGGAYVAGTDGTGFKADNANYSNFGLDWGAYNSDRNAGMDGATKSLAEGIAGALGGIMGKFGLDNYYQVGVRFASDGEDRSPGAIRITNQAGEIVAEVAGKFNKSAQKGLEELAAKAGEAIQKTLLGADLPAWAEDTLKALGDSPSIDQLNTALASIAQFETAAGAITDALGISTDAVYGLTKAFGGMQQAGAALSAYYQAYYSDAERTADAHAQLAEQMGALGVATPNSKAAFRSLVESIDVTTTAGQQLYAQLIQLSGPFAQVQDAIDQMAAEAQAQADAIAAQASGLQGRIDELTGNTAAIRERELAAIDPANRALQQRIYLLQDEAAAAAAARAAAANAQQGVVDGLQGQVDALATQFGNLAPATRTVADALADTTSALASLEDGLASLLGTAAQSPLDALKATLSSSDAISAFRASLQSAIFDARLSGSDAAGQAALLRGQEASLWAQLQTAGDPVAVAGQLQQTLLKRISAEAAAAQAATDAQAKLAGKAREDQIATLRSQIDGMSRLRSLAADIAQFVGSLDAGDLSPLAPGAQLDAARALYEQTLAAARAGDQTAQGQLTGNARAYLEEAKGYFASTAAYADVYATVRAGVGSVGAMSPTDVAVATAQAQLDALQAQGTDISTVAVNSDIQISALSALDERMAQIGEQYSGQADQQIAALKEQIAQLKGVQEGQQSQIVQAAARHAELVELLRQANAALARIQSDTALGAAA